MTNYHIRASKSQRLDLSTDYQFSNLPVTYLNEIQDEDMSILHPILDELLLTLAGEPNLGKIVAISTGSVVIFLLCILAACIYFPRFREYAKAFFIKIIPNNYLRKKLNKKKKQLATNLSLIEQAQAIEECETRKDLTEAGKRELTSKEEEKGARRKSRSRSSR